MTSTGGFTKILYKNDLSCNDTCCKNKIEYLNSYFNEILFYLFIYFLL